MRSFYKKISQVLEEIMKEYNVPAEAPLWELPERKEFGDLSTMTALKLSSKLKKEPLEIAAQLKSALTKAFPAEIEKIEIMKPGFVNVFISRNVLIDSLNELLDKNEDFFRTNIDRKILIEFVSANPTGPLSIAHGRQAVVGDIAANILEFFGSEVTREYYINDEGKQIELLVLSVEERIKELKGEEFSMPLDGYLGTYIKDIANEFLENAKGDLRTFVLSRLLHSIKHDLSLLGVKFDNWVSQRKIIKENRVSKVIETFKQKDLIYKKEGALWFSSTKFGDDKDRVVKKSDGELTYFASDIAYHQDKLDRKYEELINLWGPDHHGYIERVKASIKALGEPRDILRVLIIQLVTIKTKERMSRRKGTALLLSDLIKEVGKDASRFYYITRKNSSHLEFDIDLAQQASFDNPLYYIQYASSRIESIFKKAGNINYDSDYSKFLEDDEELILLRTLLQFSYCLEKAYYTLEPVFIIEFLKNLSAAFHKFYEKKRVLKENDQIKQARVNLLWATRIVLHTALKILGIKPLKKM